TAAPPLSPFVPLQPTGHRPPLICIHPGGGVLCYVELARRLGPDQPVYGIESPLLHGSGAAGAGLAALAAGHVEILRRSGSGPYRLAGWSVGGVIAFEMAVQLVGAGERVAELILFDSRAPSPPAAGLEPAEIAARFGLDLLGRRLPDPPFSYEEFRQLGAVERVRRILAAARAAGVLAADAGEEQVQRRLDVFDDTIRRVAGYAPTGYPGSLTLVRAQGSGGDGAGDPTLGWERLAERGVEVVWVPGDHYSLLEPPEVELVADQVKRCLERSADASHGESIPC
ncbi:MAG TPA: thioesterase domain-containing protein, partial [Thermoanaerobaculia bacterium]|nr:thioesterase domain-containing protein [Thermoanaerobaculia bacterium]